VIKKVIIFFCSVLLIVPIVYGQSSGKHKHDGLFMRFLAGPSYSTQVYDGAPTDMEVKGVSATFNFQLGATITDNLIAYGEVGGFTITDPDIEIAGKTYETEDTKSSSFGFGGGLTYYFMPVNFYIIASVLATQVTIEYTKGSTEYKGETDMGIGVFFGVGKEWWFADDWALGAAAFFSYSNVPDKGDSEITIGSTSFGVAFSATFH
jgi:hypothetical protein